MDIVGKLWGFCHKLRHDGVDSSDYIEQLTYLLFLKMADEKGLNVPKDYDWKQLIHKTNGELIAQLDNTLQYLKNEGGILGQIFAEPVARIKNATILKELIKEIDNISWTKLDADVVGLAFEELIGKVANEGKKGAGQYFTPRPLIKTMVNVMQPNPFLDENYKIADVACGTAGFLTVASEWIKANFPHELAKNQEKFSFKTFYGQELVQRPRRLALMNMFLHGVEASQTIKFGDSIENDQLPNDIDLIITNPPFGDIGIIPINRKFSIKTRNKQLNFIQHIIEKLKIGGKAAIVLTESIFKSEDAKKLWTYYLDKKEGGENVCNLHTILKLPTFFMSIKIRLYIVFLEKGKPSNQIWLYDIEKSASKAKKDSINEEVLEHFEKWYFERKQTDYSQILELSEFLGNSSKIGFKSFDECVIHKHKKLPQKVNKEYIQEKGKYPVISQSSVHEIIGYVDDETYLFNESLPVIIFGDHTRVFKYVDYPFAIHGYGVKIIIPNTDIVLPKYLFYVLKSSPISDLGYSRHFSEVSKLNIFVPPIHEQAKIVEKLDREISQLEKQEISIEKTKEEIKNRKQSLFEGVFNKYTNVVL